MPIAKAAAGAAGSQPAGRGLPSLITPTPCSPQEYLVAALPLDPAAILIERAFPGDVKAAMYNCLFAPSTVLRRRANADIFSPDVAAKLSVARTAWAAALPDRSPAAGIFVRCCAFLLLPSSFPI